MRLAPNSVTSQAIAKGAVTSSKLAKNAVTSTSVKNGSLLSSDFKKGSLLQGLKGDAGARGEAGLAGIPGLKGDAGPQGPPGHDGSATIGAQARMSSATAAPNGAQTNIPLTGASWTQSAGELNLLAGTVTLQLPSSCTGSVSNSVVLSVDNTPQTFAVAPVSPAGGTITVPVVVGTLSEPTSDTQHTMTAALANSCTGNGEKYTVTSAKLDVIKFR